MSFLKQLYFYIYSTISFVIIYIIFLFDNDFNILKLTALISLMISLSVVFHLIFIKRTFFDPRIYVMYGMFHMLLVGQIVTLFFNTSYFFGLPSNFSYDIKLKANLVILLSIITFLVVYDMIYKNVTVKYNIEYDLKLSWKKLLLYILITGLIGKVILYLYIFKLIHLHFTFLLPLTYLGNISAILSAYYIFLVSQYIKNRLYKILIQILLFINIITAILSANVSLIYPLFALIFWYLNKKYKAVQVSKKFIISLSILFPLVVVIDYISKVYQRNIGHMSFDILQKEVIHSILTLDIFNVETYTLFLYSIKLYVDNLNLFFGKTSLIFICPWLKVAFPDLRGMGRYLPIDVMGPAALHKNLSWATPPVLEFTANFWYLGPILFYALLAILVKYLYNNFYLNNTKNNFKFVIYSFVPPWLFVQERGDFNIGNLYFVYMTIIIGIIFVLSKKRRIN